MKRDTIKRRIQSGAGFSFVELLMTILILTLASGGMARGVAFARDQYRKSMVLSEAKTLCSTLSDIIKDELRNATKIINGNPPLFDSYGYPGADSYLYAVDKHEELSNRNGFWIGELWIGDPDNYPPENAKHAQYNKRLVSKAAYSTYHLQAELTVEYEKNYEQNQDKFHVTLRILDAERQSEEIVKSEFDVFPLNP